MFSGLEERRRAALPRMGLAGPRKSERGHVSQPVVGWLGREEPDRIGRDKRTGVGKFMTYRTCVGPIWRRLIFPDVAVDVGAAGHDRNPLGTGMDMRLDEDSLPQQAQQGGNQQGSLTGASVGTPTRRPIGRRGHLRTAKPEDHAGLARIGWLPAAITVGESDDQKVSGVQAAIMRHIGDLRFGTSDKIATGQSIGL